MLKLEKVNCPSCDSTDSGNIACGKDFEYNVSDQEFVFNQCCRCGVYYLSPRPIVEELPKLYDSNYEPYNFDKLPFIIKYVRNKTLIDKIKLLKGYIKSGAKILDVGCGSGEFLFQIMKQTDKLWVLAGNDISNQTLANLSDKGIEVFPGRFEEVSIQSDSICAITMLQVLEHFEKPSDVIKTAYRVLKPNGIVIIETPSFDGLDARIFKRRYWGGYHFPRHWTIFNENSIKRMLEASGFQIVKISYLPSPAFWIQSFHHYLSERKIFNKLSGLFTLHNLLLIALISFFDIFLRFFGATSNMRVIAKKT